MPAAGDDEQQQQQQRRPYGDAVHWFLRGWDVVMGGMTLVGLYDPVLCGSLEETMTKPLFGPFVVSPLLLLHCRPPRWD